MKFQRSSHGCIVLGSHYGVSVASCPRLVLGGTASCPLRDKIYHTTLGEKPWSSIGGYNNYALKISMQVPNKSYTVQKI
ncbi:hypothetical protein U1Q18_004397 [Sarracenia purpurea var. burkii]